MKTFARLSLILPCLLASGCVPYHYTERPGVAGIIVDARTELPLANVRVNLDGITGFWDATNHLSVWRTNQLASTESARDGTFEIPPKKVWNVFFIGEDVFARKYQLAAERMGHEFFEAQFTFSPMRRGKYAITNFGYVKAPPK